MIEIRRALAIVGVSILAAILYGVVHDQVTVRLGRNGRLSYPVAATP